MRTIRTVMLFTASLLLAACSGGAETAEKAAPVEDTPQTPEAYVEKAAKLRREGKAKEAADTALRAYMLARTGPRVAERLEIAKANAAIGNDKGTSGAINEIKLLEREARDDASIKLDPVDVAEVYAQIGDPNAVFRWLGRAVEARSPNLAGIADNPDFEPVKSDPRWQQFLSTIPR